VPNLFLLWWLAWLLMGTLYWIATRTSWSAVTIDELLAANALFLAADISSIVAAALAVVFVQRATSREQESARLLDLIPDDDRTGAARSSAMRPFRLVADVHRVRDPIDVVEVGDDLQRVMDRRIAPALLA
jgi:hypothetical protein